MRGQPVGLGLNQRRPFAAACAVDCFFHGLVDCQHIGAINFYAGHAVADTPGSDAAARNLQRHRDGDGVLVILAKENNGQVVYTRQVERLVPIALARAAFADRNNRYFACLPHLGRESHAHCVADLGGDGRGACDDVDAWHSRSGRASGVRRCWDLRASAKCCSITSRGVTPKRDDHTEVAIVGQEPVFAALEAQRPCRSEWLRGPGMKSRTGPCPGGSAATFARPASVPAAYSNTCRAVLFAQSKLLMLRHGLSFGYTFAASRCCLRACGCHLCYLLVTRLRSKGPGSLDNERYKRTKAWFNRSIIWRKRCLFAAPILWRNSASLLAKAVYHLIIRGCPCQRRAAHKRRDDRLFLLLAGRPSFVDYYATSLRTVAAASTAMATAKPTR